MSLSTCYRCMKRLNRNQLNLIRQVSTSRSNNDSSMHLETIFDNKNKMKVIEKLKTKQSISVKRPDLKFSSTREAGILVPMCHVNGEPSVLFMVRSLHLTTHAGEISFPGGMSDDGDTDIIHTALRETHEEIGLDQSLVDVWATLPSVPSRAKGGSNVTPVLGYCNINDVKQLQLNTAEVEAVFTRTIASLCDTDNQRQTQWRYPGSRGYTLPVFTGGDHRIWGLTAIVLHQTLSMLVPELYKFKLKHRS